MSFLADNFPLLRDAFLTTLSLAVASGLCALVLGTVLTAMRVSPVPALRGLSTVYVEVFRNTPLTVVFFFLAFGIVYVDLQFPSRFITAVAALSLYTAAFVCEALRSGINAVPVGQAEAARAIGLTFTQSLGQIVLPQAFRTSVPPLGSVLIAMFKNSAVVGAFGVGGDLWSAYKRLSSSLGYDQFPVLIGTAIGYLVITLSAGAILLVVERKVAIQR